MINAFQNSVLGMNAQATKLTAISNNIANVSTVGFKRADVQFESLVLGNAVVNSTALAGVRANTRLQISEAGQLHSTGNSTDIGIDGGGFMVVNTKADDSGAFLATRAGSFRVDANGNLVNTGGYYLQGVPTDATGAMIGSDGTSFAGLQTVNISNVSVLASPTSQMTYWANLPAGQTAPGAAATVQTSSMDYVDQLGGAETLHFSFTPTAPAAGATAATNSWTLAITDSAAASGTAPIATVDLTFNGSGPNAGQLATATVNAAASGAGAAYDATTGLLTLPAAGGGQTIALNIGIPNTASGLMQLDAEFSPTRMDKDGSAAGRLESVNVTADGKVMATFNNGQSRPIYQLRMATVANPDAMVPTHGDAFQFAVPAGTPLLQNPGEGRAGSTFAASLESSNVDLNTELTSLIETQRAYSSNATVVRTADEMMQETNNLKR